MAELVSKPFETGFSAHKKEFFMRLSRKNMLLTSFMLFSLFFGAGNLIFPPFLGQNAGNQTLPSVIGFAIIVFIVSVAIYLKKKKQLS